MSRSTVQFLAPLAGLAVAFCVAIALLLASAQTAGAAANAVGLGKASSFAVLAYSTVTNTGPSTVSGDIGVNPGTSVTGFPPGVQTSGAIYAATALSLQARTNASAAYTNATDQPNPTTVDVELGGLTLTPDLYASGGVLQITGALTLDGLGDSNAVFIFRSTATLITAAASQVVLTNNANACNVFWIVPSSATLGTGSSIVGTVIASDSIAAATGTSVTGRLLALNGAVTLDTATISSTGCAAAAVAAAPGTDSALPRTGVQLEPLVVGVAMLASGLVLVYIRRRSMKSE